jgi:hypothetical protein
LRICVHMNFPICLGLLTNPTEFFCVYFWNSV